MSKNNLVEKTKNESNVSEIVKETKGTPDNLKNTNQSNNFL